MGENKRGIFIAIRNKIGSKKAQIATFIVLFVAIIALLAAIVINIGRVSQKKAVVLNAATGASLQLSSSLASYGKMLSERFVDGGKKKCKFKWKAIIYMIGGIVFIIIGIILIIIGGIIIALSSGTASPLGTFLIYLGIAFIMGGIGLITMSVLQMAVYDRRIIAAMNSAFRRMKPEMQISESAIRFAFMNTVDDQAKVADMHDLDMDDLYGLGKNGNPKDVINRFYYKYMWRLLWLTDAAPAPDGTYRNYKKKLNKLIEDFLPRLKSFHNKCQKLSGYIGKLPTEEKPQGDTPAQPDGIDTLYDLFSYLHEKEYPSTDNPIYNFRKSENIWTRGIVECKDDKDENPADPCQHSELNDQIDAFAADLEDFSGDEGFAEGVLNPELGQERRYNAFDTWYGALYAYCADKPAPAYGEECHNLDYDDYYDKIWQVEDDNTTENIVEKGWNQLIGYWLERLGQIRVDIVNREAEENHGPEEERLKELLKKVDKAIDKLNDFKPHIKTFREDILDLKKGFEGLEGDDTYAGSSIYDYRLYSKSRPSYVWEDSLGKHSVQVEVSPFRLPNLKSYKKGCCTFCIKLRDEDGKVWVKVTRKDEPTKANFPGKTTLLWKFRYPNISYKITTQYDYDKVPKITGVELE